MSSLRSRSTLFLFVVLTQGGCTAIIRPTISPSEFFINEKKLLPDVALYVPDGFREYSSKHTDVGDLKQWQLEVGPPATDALRYALESRFENVTVHASQPHFPLSSPGPSLVVVPAFDSVKAAFPVAFKFEVYRVALTMTIRVYDSAGNELKAVTLTGKGKKTGSIGYDSAGHAALPEACRRAIKEVVDQAVEAIAELAAKQRT